LRVLLADDDEKARVLITELLSDTFEIVGQSDNGNKLVAAAADLSPDVIVTDLTMPGIDGIEAARRILASHPGLPIILLTMHSDVAYWEEATEAGVLGYVVKVDAGDELLPAVHSALAGRPYVSGALKCRNQLCW
jgi:DNA-binding NarL/FixJ family response regulator